MSEMSECCYCLIAKVVALVRCYVDTDKARKHGLDEFVQANPSKFDHHDLFSALQRLTLVYRLNDNFACLVRLWKIYFAFQFFIASCKTRYGWLYDVI